MRPKMLVGLVALLNLVAGLSFGLVIGRASNAGKAHRHDPIETALGPSRDFTRLADALRLEPEQDVRVRNVLATVGPRFDATLRDVRPRLQALHEEILGELRAVLTPEQVERLGEEYRRQVGCCGR